MTGNSSSVELPIDRHLDTISAALGDGRRLVVEAAPGAGKSTRVPPALLTAPWLQGRRIVMLEPRRVAARHLAGFLAAQLSEKVGETVGLTIRDERKVSARTRLEIVTEGVLTRRLQSDPELAGVGVVIFDEFHERHLTTDLGLALTLDAQALRDDLRILIMSATLDLKRVAAFLRAASLSCEGRQHPIETRYLGRGEDPLRSLRVAVNEALGEGRQGTLVFLPGVAEIERARRALSGQLDADIDVLHGSLPLTAQSRALSPGASGQARVILATNIAESSLTVPGVDTVIDSGLERAPQFDPGSGMTALITRFIDREAADQRRGRAGRTGPGLCLRLWSREDRLAPARRPEMLSADLSDLVLQLAAWGADPGQLSWLDPPPAGAVAQARDTLVALGAVREEGQITPLGRAMLRRGCAPRLAAMLEAAAASDLALAADLVAMLEGRGGANVSDDAARRLESIASGTQRLWRRRVGVSMQARVEPAHCGRLLAAGFPDRIARRRGEDSGYVSAGGRGLRLRRDTDLTGVEWLVAADVALTGSDATVRLGAGLDAQTVADLVAGRAAWSEEVRWSAPENRVVARRVRRLGAIELEREDLNAPAKDSILAAALVGIAQLGLPALKWSPSAQSLRERIAFVAARREGWPDVSDDALLAAAGTWLAPWLDACTTRRDFARLDVLEPLRALIGWERARELDRLAPTHIAIPSGRRARIEYAPEGPVLAVKLQEMFGTPTTPMVLDGEEAVTLHLLSPAGRPLQITQDLAHFWSHGYVEVRKEMRGRYPKHPWPQDPVSAAATALTKKRLEKG